MLPVLWLRLMGENKVLKVYYVVSFLARNHHFQRNTAYDQTASNIYFMLHFMADMAYK
ncbi:MAG: hypothetical protein ACR2MV_04385 [Lutimonas sp.]